MGRCRRKVCWCQGSSGSRALQFCSIDVVCMWKKANCIPFQDNTWQAKLTGTWTFQDSRRMTEDVVGCRRIIEPTWHLSQK
ncbi:predicted protein [Chaetoceros tenuissimus]|uniref:Uncharacterized protein n=1 Tax=Chaetoceros tenuissimus TaxID=426638 RepID=A0AAD3HBH2_9STRA|nr:predicted protein [Chaetoceros tenuissimus]